EGLQRLFKSLGVTRVVPGGQTMNPSIEELLRAVEAVPAPEVLLLPNNRNIVLTARQAPPLSPEPPGGLAPQTKSQGVAALAANEAAMAQAATQVRTVEVTTAVRSVTLDGLTVEAGAAIALIDGELALTGSHVEEVALEALERIDLAACELVTLYHGKDVLPE